MLKMLGAAGNRNVEKIRIFQRAERRALRCVNAIAGAPGFLATIACASSRRLDTSVGVPEPHVLSARLSAVRTTALPRPPHPTPRFVTLRNAPLPGRDGRGYRVISHLYT